MEKNNNKSAKEVLGLEEMTPLETAEIQGGADKQKQKQKVVVIVCDCDEDEP